MRPSACARKGYEARAARLDVTDRAGMQVVFDEHAGAYGGLDVCFANAGIDPGPGFWNPAGTSQRGRPDRHRPRPERWDRTIAINLTGVYDTIRHAARLDEAPRPGLDRRHLVQRRGAQRADRRHALHAGQGGGDAHGAPRGPGTGRVRRAGERHRAPAPSSPTSAAAGSTIPAVKAAWDSSVPIGKIAYTWQIKPLALYLASDASSYMTRLACGDRRRRPDRDAHAREPRRNEGGGFPRHRPEAVRRGRARPDAGPRRGGGQGRPLRHLRVGPCT